MIAEQLNIFFLVPDNSRLGGCISFTVHLVKTLRKLGYDPVIYRIGKKSEPQVKPFKYGLTSTVVDIDTARILARSNPSLIAYAFWNNQGDYALELMKLGVPIIVHDPAEFHDEEIAYMKSTGYKPIVIRQQNVVGLRELGVEATYVPHPYVRYEGPRDVERCYHAISAARIDFRKRSLWILEANNALLPEQQIHMYGTVNRIFEYHQLRKAYPDWKERWYHGKFPDADGEAVRLNLKANLAIDLTSIKGDGGGTQYTFFEVWDAGIPLILNADWATGRDDDEVRDAHSCSMVHNADDLIGALTRPLERFEGTLAGGAEILDAHAPEVVGPQYLEAMGV